MVKVVQEVVRRGKSGTRSEQVSSGRYLVEEVARVCMMVVGGLRTVGVLTPLLKLIPLLTLSGKLDVITGSVVFAWEGSNLVKGKDFSFRIGSRYRDVLDSF